MIGFFAKEKKQVSKKNARKLANWIETPDIKPMTDDMPPLTISPTAYNRIEEIRAQKGATALHLRISVSGGGCSGFRYDLSWDEQIGPDDMVFDDSVVVDGTSLPLIAGATIDYQTGLMGENFKIINPNASSGCGCGESFSI